ncbi:MAG: outer membrane beta-barrel protein [Verrucomicrobia bacterium]|nr:outer membrane beta-barrel protein [Verrucomicrobiota bacterium]
MSSSSPLLRPITNHSSRLLGRALSLLGCSLLPAFGAAQTAPTVVAPPPAAVGEKAAAAKPATEDDDSATESPRERSRVLTKRNPIASEYQEPGAFGRIPGVASDGEGVDFRAFFGTPGLKRPGPQPGLAELTYTYNALAAAGAWGGQIGWRGATPGERPFIIDLRVQQQSAIRAIQFYEAAWEKTPVTLAPGTRYLDRARISQDDIDTTNRTARVALEKKLAPGLLAFVQFSGANYDDVAQRNRIEFNYGAGTLSSATGTPQISSDGSLLQANSANAGTRRYFSDAVTGREIRRYSAGLILERPRFNVDLRGYLSDWQNHVSTDAWNFTESKLALSYDLSSPWFPRLEKTAGTPYTDLTQANFNDLRLQRPLTVDKDRALRLDTDWKLLDEETKAWLLTGFQYRSKERTNRETRSVYLRNAAAPLTLAEVARKQDPGKIMQDTYVLPRAIDFDAGLHALSTRPASFAYNSSRSIIESYQQLYDSSESVSAAHLGGLVANPKWEVEGGVRLEQTENTTLGTSTTPASLDTGTGKLLASVVENGVTQNIRETTGEKDYRNVLPSLGLAWKDFKPFVFRAAAYQSLMRPQYFDLVAYRRVNPPTRTITEGNPNLEPTELFTTLLAVERGLPGSGKIGLELYRIGVEGFFHGARATELLDGALYSVSRVENGGEGTIQGFQLFYRQPLKTSTGLWTLENVYTYSDTEAEIPGRPGQILPMPERSRHLFRSNVRWERGSWGAQLAGSFQSRALDSIGETTAQDLYRGNVVTLTPGITWRYKAIQAGLEITNLLDYPERTSEAAGDRVTQNQYSRETYRFSVSARF